MATLQSQINILISQIHNLYKNIPEPKNDEISFDYGELKTTFTKKGETTEINYLGSKSYDIIIYIGEKGNYILKSGDLIEPPTEEDLIETQPEENLTEPPTEEDIEYLFKDKIYKLSDGDYIGIDFYLEGSLSIRYYKKDQKKKKYHLD